MKKEVLLMFKAELMLKTETLLFTRRMEEPTRNGRSFMLMSIRESQLKDK
jgi:hypothetical protein